MRVAQASMVHTDATLHALHRKCSAQAAAGDEDSVAPIDAAGLPAHEKDIAALRRQINSRWD